MINSNVRITFERILNRNITGYEVLATDKMTAIQKRIAVIDNPTSPIAVKFFTRIYDTDRPRSDIYTRIYDLKHKNIMLDQEHAIQVFVNGDKIDSSLYIINTVKQQLLVFALVKDTDIIEIEYYIDGIEYEFVANKEQTYTVKPIIDENNVLIGRHNILK